MIDILPRLARALSGSYVVEREIGRGGMATVFLARDVKHQRPVAIKVLHPELAAVLGAERFLSEINVTANLQHPNLLPLFDSGDADGYLYYVMPYIEGESLRRRLDRERQLPVDEAVHIAAAIGNALDYAHARGIVHRDLKPENILLQHGQPIVADFGIALAISNAGGSRITLTGVSLGTPQYMSPEQAVGERQIDGRSDIYSLAAMLFEMLVGEPPHVGPTVQATIAKVVSDRPRPLRSIRETVPVHVELAVAKALAKLPADRFSSASMFVRALEGHVSDPGFLTTPETDAARSRSWIRHPASLAVLCALAVLAALSLRPRTQLTTPANERTVRFDLALPPGLRLANDFGHPVSLSSDGRRLAYIAVNANGESQIWIRDLDQAVARPLAGTNTGEAPTFTPDGRSLLFRLAARGYMMKMPIEGGPAQPLFPAIAPERVTFIGTDTVVYGTTGPGSVGHLYAVPLAGGQPVRLLKNDSSAVSVVQDNPYFAPDGRTLFFASSPRPNQFGRIIAFTTLSQRTISTTTVQGTYILGYVAGRLIYVNDAGSIMALGFDLDSHRTIGEPVATGEVVRIEHASANAFLSNRGDLAFISDAGALRPVLIGRSGAQAIPVGDRSIRDVRYSPDGARIAFSIADGARTDVWVYVVASRSLDRLTTQGVVNDRPEWTPDGKRVLFRTDRDGPTSLWWQPVDGSGPAERLTPPDSPPVLEGIVTPDGKTLVYRVDRPAPALRDILAIPLTGERTPVPVLATEFDELSPRVSPDGKWMAYVSTESGRDEVYVRPFPSGGGRTLVSTDGGREPLWSRDGKRVFFRRDEIIFAATVTLGSEAVVTRRDTAAAGSYSTTRFHPQYDVAPDGRLLVLERFQPVVSATIVLNWGAALAARLGPVR